MNYLQVRNWDRFQHYKKKSGPPLWIKLHRTLLHDYEFGQLSEVNKGRLIRIWLLAASMNNRIPHDDKWVAKQISAQTVDLSLFISRGFLEILYEDSSPEKKRIEKKREEQDENVLQLVDNLKNSLGRIA